MLFRSIHLVNPARREIDGAPVFASVRDIPGAVDHAFVMTPAREVARVLDDCIAARVPLVTVYSDGFADVGGEGVARQNALVAAARTGGVRLLGPNSMGTISPISGIALTVNTVMESVDLRRGSTALVSQSGSMIGSLLSRAQARGHAFSRLVAVEIGRAHV